MIYVLSDIHGNKENFDAILKQIHLTENDTLYILGDVIDRYPYGIQLLQQIMGMPNTHMLLGNHEWMMMKALDISCNRLFDAYGVFERVYDTKEGMFDHWYANSGNVTHDDWNRLSAKERETLGDYLSRLPLSYEVSVNGQNFRLVHAAPAEFYGKYLTHPFENVIEFAVWDREMTGHWHDTNRTIIFGHTPTSHMQDNNPLEIWKSGSMIGIDCGSGFPAVPGIFSMGGRLACLRLDDMEVFYSG